MKPNDYFWPWYYKAAPTELPHFGLWFWKWYVSIKPTKDELFSERNGYISVVRFNGWSLVYGRRHR